MFQTNLYDYDYRSDSLSINRYDYCQNFRLGDIYTTKIDIACIDKNLHSKMNDKKYQVTPNDSVENRLEAFNTDAVESNVNEIVDKQPNVTNLDEFQIFIKIPDGETYGLIAKSTYEIRKVLRILGAILGDDDIQENVTLSYAGIALQDELTLGYYNISKMSTLFLNGIICGDVVNSGKFSRLTNLFRYLIAGLPNQSDIVDQLNALTDCECVRELKEYDRVYPPECV